MPRPAPRPKQGVSFASAGSQQSVSTGNFLARSSSDDRARTAEPQQESVVQRVSATFSRWIGLGGDETKPAAPPAAARPAPPARPSSRSPQPATTASIAPRPRPQPQPAAPAEAESQKRSFSAGGATTISGAAPVIQADSFESRWTAAR
jgi:hypothetical protein